MVTVDGSRHLSRAFININTIDLPLISLLAASPPPKNATGKDMFPIFLVSSEPFKPAPQPHSPREQRVTAPRKVFSKMRGQPPVSSSQTQWGY